MVELLKRVLPWRMQKVFDDWLEHRVRVRSPTTYKFLKFGRTNINTAAYWDEVWADDVVSREYPHLHEFIEQRVPASSRVLDVGAGSGVLAERLRVSRNADVTCFDFSRVACDRLAERGFQIIHAALPAIPRHRGSYDVVVATEVLEHLDDPLATLEAAYSVTRVGGLLMCSVPNDALHPHEELEHQHSFDRESFSGLLSRLSAAHEISVLPTREGTDRTILVGVVYKKQ